MLPGFPNARLACLPSLLAEPHHHSHFLFSRSLLGSVGLERTLQPTTVSIQPPTLEEVHPRLLSSAVPTVSFHELEDRKADWQNRLPRPLVTKPEKSFLGCKLRRLLK